MRNNGSVVLVVAVSLRDNLHRLPTYPHVSIYLSASLPQDPYCMRYFKEPKALVAAPKCPWSPFGTDDQHSGNTLPAAG